MIRALMQLLGVDFDQWLALTRVALKLDLRAANAMQFSHRQEERSEESYRSLILRFVFYVFMGAVFSGLVLVNKNVFFTGIIFLSYTMVMTAMMILVDFAAVVISPDDFSILGYQPISSRTFFFSRLTNVLVYSTSLSLALGLVPIVAYFFVLGFRPLLGVAAFAATLLAGLCTTMFLVVVYAGILRIIHPNKLRRVISYIQLMLSFLIYGGYSILPRMFNAQSFTKVSVSKSVWLLALPPAWFASYLDLAAGRWGATEVIPSVVSVIALMFLAYRAQGKLALEYSDRLSEASAVSEGPKKLSSAALRPALIFRRGEARVVALLVRNQFKYDQKFRLAVLSILPLTVMYLYMGLRDGPLADPFVVHASRFGNSFLLYLAVLMFPTMLRMSLMNSDSYQASWIYYATPADRGRLVLGAKDFVFAYFVLPYLLFIGVVFLYFFRNALHVLLLLIVLGLLSHFFLQLAVFFNPALPFSQPIRKGQRSSGYLMTLVLGPFLSIAFLLVLAIWVYPRPWLLAAVLICFAALSWIMEKALRIRVVRRSISLEYQG
jgi:ABC-2 type transport system permease protein